MNRAVVEGNLSAAILNFEREHGIYTDTGSAMSLATMDYYRGRITGYLRELRDIGAMTPEEISAIEMKIDQSSSQKPDRKVQSTIDHF